MLLLIYRMPPRNMADMSGPKELTWSIGDASLKAQIKDIEAAFKPTTRHYMDEGDGKPRATILSIAATGPELDYIVDHFGNVPYRKGGTFWEGEWAKFIFDNFSL